jgi:hypothetical protein
LIAGALVTGWVVAIVLPLFVAYVLVFGLKKAENSEAAAQRQRVDEKIRWLLVEHCLDDTPANRAYLMQLRWPIPKVKKR